MSKRQRKTAKQVKLDSENSQMKPSLMRVLEARLLFDAAAAAEVISADQQANTDAAEHALQQDQDENDTQHQAEQLFNQQNNNHDDEPSSTKNEVIFIDTSVPDYASFADGLARDAQIFYIDSSTDGILQVADALEKLENLDAIHIITHGTSGQIKLGDAKLNSDTMDDYQDALASWRDALTDNGDILLYGCHVAEDLQGQQFIEQLSEILEADIAASDNLTGHATKGGDWVLESSALEVGGTLETYQIFSDNFIDSYQHVLPNSAPVLTDVDFTLTAITESNTGNDGDQISNILGANVSDIDLDSIGIAITSTSNGGAGGVWQFTTDGFNWSDIGVVSEGSALLLSDTDRIRFNPDDTTGGDATFTFHAWDQTSPDSTAAGTKTDVRINGGETAFSSDSDNATITVSSINDQPVLTDSNFLLTTINEDNFDSAGDTVAVILATGTVTDVETADLGMAISSVNNTNGTWQYRPNGGGWSDIPTIDVERVFLVTDDTELRFVPDVDYNGISTITFYAWDQTDGTAHVSPVLISSLDATSISAQSDDALIRINAINDAPVLDNSTDVTFDQGTDEDTTSNAQLVSSILDATVTEVDSGAVEGIAIHHASGNGTWQYSLDGNSWQDITNGDLASNNALLLNADNYLRYVPDNNDGETAAISYYAWDQTSGAAGEFADASTRGNSTAFSSDSETASMTVTSVNDAPVLTASTPSLTTITEDDLDNDGQTITDILNGSVSDIDADSIGIAVVYLEQNNGSWQYQIDNGDWTDFGAVDATSAFLLGPNDKMRFVPDGNNGGFGQFSYYAWDLTANNAGDTVDLSNNANRGGSTAFSSQDDTANITVTTVNDAPLLDNSGDTVFNIGTDEDNSSVSQSVFTILNGIFSDVDDSFSEGIAIHAVTGNGTWQYSFNGSTWFDVGVVDGENALLLEEAHELRYIPDSDNGETASIQFYAWDTSSRSAGERVDTTIRGGSTAFSTASETATMTITDVNDAPVLDNLGNTTFDVATDEDTTSDPQLISSLLDATVSDVDSGAVEGIAIHAASGNGTWQYSLDGNNWQDIINDNLASSNALLLNADDYLRYVPDNNDGETATISYYA